MPDGHDEELALIFQEMRKASGLGLESLAQQLATTPRTLQRFEDGAILSLPQWSETTRLITEYAGMLGLDGQPILRRIEAQLRTIAASGAVSDPDSNPAPGQGTLADELPPPEAPEPARAPSSPLSRARPVEPQADDAVAVPPWRVSDAQTDAPPLPDRDGVDASYDEGPRDLDADDGRWPEELQRFDPDAEDDAARARRFGVLRAHPLAAIFGSIAVLLVLIVLFAPGVIRSGLMALPDPVPAVVKSVWSSGEQAGQPGAPNVIDSDDPRSRKADKLTGPGIVGQ